MSGSFIWLPLEDNEDNLISETLIGGIGFSSDFSRFFYCGRKILEFKKKIYHSPEYETGRWYHDHGQGKTCNEL